MKISSLDINHPLLINQLNDFDYINDENFISFLSYFYLKTKNKWQ